MSECLPDLPRYIRQRGNEWQGADHQNGPWRPIPAPQSGLPWKTDGPAVPESREPASVVAEARPLSPAAQAVSDAANYAFDRCGTTAQGLAAALRAVADHLLPEEPSECKEFTNEAVRLNRMGIRSQLLDNATELEAQP